MFPDRSQLMAKAKQIADVMDKPEFKALNRWFDCLKKHGI